MKNEKFEDLADAIHKRNELVRIAGPALERVKEICKTFIGKKIKLATGGKTEKFNDAVKFDIESFTIKPLPTKKWANIHRLFVKFEGNDLCLEISLCFGVAVGCTYENQTFYFGKLEHGVLTSINDLEVITTPLDYDTELAKIKEFRMLEQKAKKAKAEIKVNESAYHYIDNEDFE